jgi:hypothetical protein
VTGCSGVCVLKVKERFSSALALAPGEQMPPNRSENTSKDDLLENFIQAL